MADRYILRRLWFQAHLWIGVALFLVLIPLSVTGSLLVWHDALDETVNPQRYAVTGAANRPLEAYAEAARAVLAEDQPVSAIRLPEHDGGPVVVSAPMAASEGAAPGRGRPPQGNVWIDPGSARVLDQGRSDQGLVRWLHVFHGSLMVPGLGRKVVGWLGWLMLASALTGIWLWWPRNGKVQRGLRWRRTSLTSSNLHHQVGFWVSLPLAVLAFTGAYISFPQTFRGLVGAMTGAPPPAAKAAAPAGPGRDGPARPLAETRRSPDEAVAAVRAQQPAGRLVAVTYPTERKAQWIVRLQPGGLLPISYAVDDRSGTVKPDGPRPDAAARTARLMRVVHDGGGTGWLWQAIIFLAGLAPAVLGVTGVIMWLRNRGGRRARNAWRTNGG